MRALDTIKGRRARCWCIALSFMMTPGTAQAIDWCNLNQLMPTYSRSFDDIARVGGVLTGCVAEPTESAHEMNWRCKADPIDTIVGLTRVPDRGTLLTIIFPPSDSLDPLRKCNWAPATPKTFNPGSIIRRDSMTVNYSNRIILLNDGPHAPSVIVAGTDTMVEWATSEFERGSYGITYKAYPTSAVRVAGIDLIRSPLSSLLDGLRSRGSNVLSSAEGDARFPEYSFSPPIGLPGVKSIKVEGLLDHIWMVTYEIAQTSDYERFIALLDAEYGRSERSTGSGGCTSRWWFSGNVSIEGQFCTAKPTTLTFINDVVNQQFLDSRKHDQAERQRPVNSLPRIDPDNF